MNQNIRHGEVFLLQVDKVPKLKATKYDAFIVGHSETGHHHILESKTKFDVITDEEKNELYIRLFEPAKLVHKKTVNRHKDLTVLKGTYKVIRKTEYNPFTQLTTAVWD